MPIQIEYEPNDIYVLRISGTLKQSEFAAEQADIARRIDSGSKPRVLVIGEKFEGWERGADWNDLDFHDFAWRGDRKDCHRGGAALGSNKLSLLLAREFAARQ